MRSVPVIPSDQLASRACVCASVCVCRCVCAERTGWSGLAEARLTPASAQPSQPAQIGIFTDQQLMERHMRTKTRMQLASVPGNALMTGTTWVAGYTVPAHIHARAHSHTDIHACTDARVHAPTPHARGRRSPTRGAARCPSEGYLRVCCGRNLGRPATGGRVSVGDDLVSRERIDVRLDVGPIQNLRPRA
jgi:hypothetical protein